MAHNHSATHWHRRDHARVGDLALKHQEQEPERLRQVHARERHANGHREGRPVLDDQPRREPGLLRQLQGDHLIQRQMVQEAHW